MAPMKTIPEPPPAVLRYEAAARYVGLTRQAIWRKAKAGRFPQPIRLSKQAVGFRRSELDAWVAARPRANGAAG